MNFRLHLMTAIVAVGLSGTGLPRVTAQATETPEVTLRFLFLDESPGAYRIQIGSDYRHLNSGPYAISKPVQAKPDSRLKIFKDDLVPDPKTGRKERAQIATVTPPVGATETLVVITPRPLVPGSTVAPTYDVAYFESTPKSFPPGSVRVLNLGRAAIAASLGAKPVIVEPGTEQIVHPVTDSRHRVFCRIAIREGDGWRLFSDTIAVVRPDERVTGVCVYSASGLAYTYLPEEIAENGPPPPGHFWLTYAERN